MNALQEPSSGASRPETLCAKSAEHSMLSGRVLPTFLRYGIPWTLGFMAVSSAGVVDGLFIGRYAGAMPLASVNLVVPLLAFYLGIGVMCATGGGVRTSKYMGEGNRQAASAMFTKTVVGVAALSGTMAVLGLLFITPLVALLGADVQLQANCMDYLRMILLFGPCLALSMTMSVFVRAEGWPRLASTGLLLSAGLNILLDYLFIAHLGWGVTGAGLATGLANLCSLVYMARFFATPKATLRFTRKTGSWKELLMACANGSSEFINEASLGTVILFTNILLMRYIGPNGVAAFTIVAYALWFGEMLAYGLSDTLAPLVSISYGARRPDRCRAFLSVALVCVVLPGIMLFGVLSLVPEVLITFFLPGDATVTDLTVTFMHYARWTFLLCGVNMVLTAYFTGLQRAAHSAMVALSRTLVLPLLLLGFLPQIWGYVGIFVATPIAELCTMLLAVRLFWRGRKSTGW